MKLSIFAIFAESVVNSVACLHYLISKVFIPIRNSKQSVQKRPINCLIVELCGDIYRHYFFGVFISKEGSHLRHWTKKKAFAKQKCSSSHFLCIFWTATQKKNVLKIEYENICRMWENMWTLRHKKKKTEIFTNRISFASLDSHALSNKSVAHPSQSHDPGGHNNVFNNQLFHGSCSSFRQAILFQFHHFP